MAIGYIGNTVSGLSSDPKPSPSANEKGLIFVETDTDKIYQWDTDSWNEIAGSGGTTTTLVANGALTTGKGVYVDSNGKATALAETYAAVVNTSIGSAGGAVRPIMCYDTNADRVVVAYQRESNNHGESSVGEVNADGSISWGTAVEFDQGSTSQGIRPLCMVFNASTNKVQIVYNSYDTGGTNNYKLYSKVGTVDNSDNSITWIPSGNLEYPEMGHHQGYLSGTAVTQGQAVYHPGATKLYWHYIQSSANVRQLEVLDPSGTPDPDHQSLSDSTPFSNTSTASWTGIAYASVNSTHRLLLATATDSGGNGYGQLVCGTVESDDDDVSWGSVATFVTSDLYIPNDVVIGWDSDNEKGLVVYTDNNSYGKFATFTINTGTNAITVNSGTNEAGFFMSSDINSVNIMYNEDANHFVIAYRNNDTYDDIHFKTATLNGSDNTVSWSSNDSTGGIVIYTGSSSNEARSTELTYSPANINMVNYPDATPGVLVCWWRDVASTGSPQGYVTRLANLGTNYNQSAGVTLSDEERVIGLSQGTFSDGQTATITLAGGTNTSVPGGSITGESSLTVGSTYYLLGDGTLKKDAPSAVNSVTLDIRMGIALSSTSLFILNDVVSY